MQRIHLTLHTLSSNNTRITFISIPGHIDFLEHGAVDSTAKRATGSKKITDGLSLLTSDYKQYFRSLALQSWNLLWKNECHNNVLLIKQISSPWTSSTRNSRREEVTLTHLRTGHTRLTHSYLLNPYILSPSSCPHCQEENLTVDHFFSCPHLSSPHVSYNIPPILSSSLKNKTDLVTRSLLYFRGTKLLPYI